MAEFITTSGASAALESIIRNAKREIIICSPFLKISKQFHERLLDADKKNIKINIVYGKNKLDENELEKIVSITHTNLYFLENLHAKCYSNENQMIITSMNFYEYSQLNNREMGILIEQKTDKDIFEDAMSELKSILQNSKRVNVDVGLTKKNITKKKFGKSKKEITRNGFCIRCGERIELDQYKPYCIDCYHVWVEYSNPDYIENYCHACGNGIDTTMDKPFCYQCYKNIR